MSWLTDAELRQLEQKSLENMISFYDVELTKIAHGARAPTLLTNPMIHRFKLYGILIDGTSDSRTGRKLKLTSKGYRLLGIPEKDG